MNSNRFAIIENFERPDPTLISGFKDIPVATIDDCMCRMAAVDSAIKPISKAKLLGPAFTVSVPAGDNLLLYYAIEKAKPRDIIAITDGGFSNRALCGEIMVTLAKKRGIGGFLIDGAIRDADALSRETFPVFARNISPNGPIKHGPGEVNCSITIGGKVVNPGDIIVGDSDGVVIIPPEHAAEIQACALQTMQKEREILSTIKSTGFYDFTWLHEKLSNLNI